MEASMIRPRAGRPPGGVRTGDDGLTDRQRQVLDCITSSVRTRGYPPSMREIGQAVGLTSTSSVSHQLASLEKKGFVRKDPNRPRTYAPLRPLSSESDAANSDDRVHDVTTTTPQSQVAEVPLIGRIAAGTPITAAEDVDGVLPLPRQLVGHGDLFALTVTGHSMAGEGSILDGDVVVVRRQPVAELGAVVAALIDGEATVKRLRRDGTDVWLDPDNRDYEPILGNEASILGKVVAVMRGL
ncbi:transcriptional repressor LexA (plasmid) [Streptomyces sp. NBC_01298]|uniref:transcriptional repressor LexA n=1 Tax=Streptomyces sp. NBC_01298 TaxID=2903817 RepID=UPI002E15216C|nr:transcriptional repressor LexA [Streptomyces sp. NBC_01298]